MLELESYKVEGLRALLDTEQIPLRAPTILTGGNDGGKSTALHAIAFFLGAWKPSLEDYTVLGPPEEGSTAPIRSERVVVTAELSLDPELAQKLAREAGAMQVRRSVSPESNPRYEVLDELPADERLRSLETRKLDELRSLCEELGLTPEGKKNSKATWLQPLQELAANGEKVNGWTPCPAEIVEQLPKCLIFSSTEEPAPAGQVKRALKVAYEQAIENEDYTGPLRDAENLLRERLEAEAETLCQHIGDRCPELSQITIEPQVALSEGFSSVEVRTSRGSVTGIPLERSGAGRQRQVNLAIWEWVEQLLEARPEGGRGVVIAYDEPDTHLDYGHQRELVNLIQTQCERAGTKMIVATHSLNLIDRVNINDVVHLRLVDDHTQIVRLLGDRHDDTQRHLADVSAAMGLRNSVLLHERCFVGVEGPTETQAFPLLFTVATGMSLQSAGIALIAGNSNEGALRFAQFLRENERKVAFVVDRDSIKGESRRSFRKDKLDEIGIPDEAVHYVGEREVEDLFSLEQWVEAANVHWPRDDGEQWCVENLAAIRLASKFSGALYNLIRGGSEKAPVRKQGYLVALAETLRSPEEVPEELRNVFTGLVNLAADT
ncbi:MAG TPA: TOPRIM nucleotidyl transferase/hydrolase domain-containing protein [Solirubrobacterales bacterium]